MTLSHHQDSNATRSNPGRGTLALLLLLGLLGAAPLVHFDLFPGSNLLSPLPFLLLHALPLALFAFITGLRLVFHRPVPSRIAPLLLAGSLIGLCLFVLPAALDRLAVRGLSSLTTTGLSSLIPVFCAVLEPHINPTDSPRTGNHALLASLAGFSGVLLVFPFALPGSGAAAIGLAASLGASISIALGYCLLTRSAAAGASMLIVGFCATLFAAIFLSAIALWSRPSLPIGNTSSAAFVTLAIELLLQAAAIGLLFLLARQLSATRLAAPKLISLLLAVLLEAALLQQPISVPIAIGLLLLAAGAAALLFANSYGDEPVHLH